MGRKVAEDGVGVDADSGYAGAGAEDVSSDLAEARGAKHCIMRFDMTIAHTLVPKPPPLEVDEDGVVRVGQTRVTLDTVVKSYLVGDTVEQIAQAYDTLRLADVHAVISYYLSNRDEVDAYLAEQDKLADQLQQQIESKTGTWAQLRAKLLERKEKMGK